MNRVSDHGADHRREVRGVRALRGVDRQVQRAHARQQRRDDRVRDAEPLERVVREERVALVARRHAQHLLQERVHVVRVHARGVVEVEPERDLLHLVRAHADALVGRALLAHRAPRERVELLAPVLVLHLPQLLHHGVALRERRDHDRLHAVDVQHGHHVQRKRAVLPERELVADDHVAAVAAKVLQTRD
jgi:hypothetical protein